MTEFTMTLEEARALTIAPDPDLLGLRLALTERLDAVEHMLNVRIVEKRAFKADEQRKFDDLQAEVREFRQLDTIASTKYDARRRDLENARRGVDHLIRPEMGDPTKRRKADELGSALVDAIGEVRSGKVATAYVDPAESRALLESGSGGLGVPTQFGQPVFSLIPHSVMMNLPGVVHIEATTGDRYRLPRFNAVTIGADAENATLTAANTDLDAIDIVYQKFDTYETISTELEEDFDSAALSVLGNRMLRDLGAKVDNGLLQGTGASDVLGLFNQPGVSTTSVAALPTNMDKIAEAEYQLDTNDGTASAWIMAPRTWRILRQIKTGIASDNRTLLEPDPEVAPRMLSGLPVYTSSQISITTGATSVGSTAAVVDASQIVIVTRRAPRLEVSRDFKFDRDAVAIRATTRIGLGLIDAAGGVSLLTDIRAS